jgi:hypothetical protein
VSSASSTPGNSSSSSPTDPFRRGEAASTEWTTPAVPLTRSEPHGTMPAR